jgi:hypothetical protein
MSSMTYLPLGLRSQMNGTCVRVCLRLCVMCVRVAERVCVCVVCVCAWGRACCVGVLGAG